MSDWARAHTYRDLPFDQGAAATESVLLRLAAHSRSHGSDPCLTAVAANGSTTTLSYRELHQRSGQFAEWLRRDLRAAPGDVVGLMPTNDVPSVVAVLGVLRAGCTLQGLDPAAPLVRLRDQARSQAAELILRSAASLTDLPEAVVLEPLPLGPPQKGAVDVDQASDAILLATSGSTSTAKVVAQSHRNASTNAIAVVRHHDLARGDRLLGCLPVHHVNGMHFTLFASFMAGAHAVLLESFDPFTYPRILARFRPRLASVVPSILEALLSTWRRPTFPDEFAYFVSAAAPLAADTAREVSGRLGGRVLQGYGLTETTNFSTIMPRGLSRAAERRLVLDAAIPSIGAAVHGNEVAVLRPDGTRAALGEAGEICMRGHNVMSRYAGNEADTAEAFAGGWFHSQDLGFEVVDPDHHSRFFVLTGRLKNVAKVSGKSVSLEEVERLLRDLPGIRDAACIAIPHRLLGEEIIAVVVLDGQVDVLSALSPVLPPSAIPRRVVSVAGIPRSTTGKLRRSEIARGLGVTTEGAWGHRNAGSRAARAQRAAGEE